MTFRRKNRTKRKPWKKHNRALVPYTSRIKAPGQGRKQALDVNVRQLSFPTSRVVRMKFTATTRVAAPFTNSFILFSANSITNPIPGPISGTDRPLGYNEWSKFYTSYVVLRSTIQVKFCCLTTGNPLVVSCQLTDSTLPPATTMEMIQQGTTKYQILQSAVNGNVVQNIHCFYSAKGWHEVVDVADSDNLIAKFGSDPADRTYYQVGVNTLNPVVSSAAEVQYLVSIVYTVLCLDSKALPESIVP